MADPTLKPCPPEVKLLPQVRQLWRRTRQSAVFFGIFATGVKAGANLLLLPFLLSKLSTAEVAIWWVFGVLGAFGNLADFGFGQAITRIYSYLWAGAEDFDAEGLRPPPQSREPNMPRIRQLHETVRYFYLRLALGAMALLAVVGTCLLLRRAAEAPDPRLVWAGWAGFVLSIGYNLAANRWVFACQGLGRVREMQIATVCSGLINVGASALLLLAGCGLLSLVAGYFLSGLVLRGICCRVYYRVMPKQHGLSLEPDTQMLKRLWPNASKLGMISLGACVLVNGNVLISSLLLGDKITADFGLTVQVGVFCLNFASLWLNVKWPELAMLRTQGRLEDVGALCPAARFHHGELSGSGWIRARGG